MRFWRIRRIMWRSITADDGDENDNRRIGEVIGNIGK
jgi:hypothetical protein